LEYKIIYKNNTLILNLSQFNYKNVELNKISITISRVLNSKLLFNTFNWFIGKLTDEVYITVKFVKFSHYFSSSLDDLTIAIKSGKIYIRFRYLFLDYKLKGKIFVSDKVLIIKFAKIENVLFGISGKVLKFIFNLLSIKDVIRIDLESFLIEYLEKLKKQNFEI